MPSPSAAKGLPMIGVLATPAAMLLNIPWFFASCVAAVALLGSEAAAVGAVLIGKVAPGATFAC